MRTILIFALISIISTIGNCAEDTKIVRARLESCPGCSLNRLSEVRAFAYDDIPKYDDNVEFKKIQGHPPELVFVNAEDEEVERHPLKALNRQECNELLQSKGFKPRANKEL